MGVPDTSWDILKNWYVEHGNSFQLASFQGLDADDVKPLVLHKFFS
jgi:hypothetical protein